MIVVVSRKCRDKERKHVSRGERLEKSTSWHLTAIYDQLWTLARRLQDYVWNRSELDGQDNSRRKSDKYRIWLLRHSEVNKSEFRQETLPLNKRQFLYSSHKKLIRWSSQQLGRRS